MTVRTAPTLFKHLDTGHYYTLSDGPMGKFLGHMKYAHPHGTGGLGFALNGKQGRSFDRFIPVAHLSHEIINEENRTFSTPPCREGCILAHGQVRSRP